MDVEHYRNMMKAITEIEHILLGMNPDDALCAIEDIKEAMTVWAGFEE